MSVLLRLVWKVGTLLLHGWLLAPSAGVILGDEDDGRPAGEVVAQGHDGAAVLAAGEQGGHSSLVDVSKLLASYRNSSSSDSSSSSSDSSSARDRHCVVEGETWKSMTVPLGLPDETFLPMAFEIEAYFTEELKSDDDMLELAKTKFSDITRQGQCSERMFEVKADHDNEKGSWVWEKELEGRSEQSMWEMSSPIDLSNEEVELGCIQTAAFQKAFSKQIPEFANPRTRVDAMSNPPGLHAHVAAKCLLTDERRLVALLLTWDNLFSEIQKITGSEMHTQKKFSRFAETYHQKNPDLYEWLKGYVNKKSFTPGVGVERLEEKFNELETAMGGGNADPHNGYRRFELNVCHLLNVPCAHNWAKKNKVPKFGGIEFRGFDSMLGEELRLVLMLMQRSVQTFCSKDLEELHAIVVIKDPKEQAEEFLKLLGMEKLFSS